ncbi:MAG: DUF4906 domain-containing protein [Bacteroidales bacterium]|nr:DUF4906 domain-containing protein [Bacteroidales bacterium]
MKRLIILLLIIPFLLTVISCQREMETPPVSKILPEGTPVVLTLGFGANTLQDIQIGTKAEVTRADESRIHDLYVLIFRTSGSKEKIYGRYFTYEHQYANLTGAEGLLSQENEGWYVDNLLRTDSDPNKQTRGVVKISTISAENCKLVLLANISNTVTSIKDPNDPDSKNHDAIDWLSREDLTLDDFETVNVTLEQNVVNRSNLFLMMGTLDIANTGEMTWDKTNGTSTSDYGSDYKVNLTPLDAKIKFRIRYDQTNISDITPRYWQAFNLPDRCMLAESDKTPGQIGTQFFQTGESYFEGTETEDGVTWQVFTFYMLESKPNKKKTASSYYLRDKYEKNSDGTNKETWEYAPQDGAYVKFDVILSLTTEGIRNLLNDPETNHALTSDALFTIHLGDFTSSQSGGGHDYDNYKVERGNAYTYNITILNSSSIYAEVMSSSENEPGHEGSLLLTTDEIINCDAHYEYHNMIFKANPALAASEGQNKLSWYIKTPFTEPDQGRPVYNNSTHQYDIPVDGEGNPTVDYKWVKFGLNKKVGSLYTDKRFPYPGDGAYEPDWDPTTWDPSSNPVPALIDVNQLINLLFDQNKRKANGEAHLFDSADEVCFTAFINEYYYEVHPLTGELDPDLWRLFINAKPRELHILSEATYSKDLQSDVITSSHSVIQNSIQTFYNTYSPDLTSIWGTEHKDEMRNRGAQDASTGVNKSWSWWPSGRTVSGIINDEENGRINTASIWGLADAPAWDTFLNYEVENDMPDLRANYQYMAYSCLSRNRDNNGNGIVDPEELRWYTAAINQLVGMWVGNESLSQSARIYQPIDAYSADPLRWRAHVLSSTCDTKIGDPRVIRGEEGATKSYYDQWDWAFPSGSPQEYRDRVSSIRCVRNAGTFRQNGVETDITYAPYDQFVDQYYEVPAGTNGSGHMFPNSDGTYTIRFSRLNPKSIREYTSEDLPYHDENSFHNRVYLELNLQAATNTVVDEGTLNTTQRNLNNNITNTGYNSYCPAGYRLPNMTELLMMTSLTSSDYWGPTANLFPCRTYFSRGIIGDNRTGTESSKIGWQYSHSANRVHMANDTQVMNSLRCVRDKDMTGDITGKVTVANYDELKNEESTTITLNFSSMASAIRSIEVALVYSDATGEHSIRIDEADNVSFSGVTVNKSFTYTVPEAGTSRGQLPVRGWMKVRAVVSNAAGMQRTFETPVRVISDMTVSIKLLPCDYDSRGLGEDPYPFPVLLTAYNEADQITSWKLKITSPDKATATIDLGTPNAHYATTVYNYNVGNSLLQGTYSFQLEASCASETARSEVVSMDILKEQNWDPMADVDFSSIEQASDIAAYRWERQIITGLDFVAGDFIEADMDISRCIPIVYDGTSNNDVGMDLLLSIGLNGIDWVPWVLNVQFPAVENGNSGLYLNPTWIEGTTTKYAGYTYSFPDPDYPLHIRLEKGGAYWNGQSVDESRWGTNQNKVQSVIEKLTAANTLYIGSTEGYHRSRAIYRFIRVVHNGRDSSTTGGDSYFKDNPGHGGQL